MSKDLVPKWRAYVKSIEALRGTAFRLMSHPDVTPEQLWETHMKLVAVLQVYRETVPKARAKWPAYKTFEQVNFK